MEELPPLNIPSSSPTIASRRSGASTPRTPLSLDLSGLPPLITPDPPANTLIITNLDNPAIFRPENLIEIRQLINQYVPIHTWAPLKSFRRIIVSFFDVESAVLIRKELDNEIIFDCRVRIYFGKETKIIAEEDMHLHLPKSDKLFFISPPPSPPHGWMMKNEDPPNKEVHADDLAQALAKLHARNVPEPVTPEGMETDGPITWDNGRARSGSTTMIYHPKDHGDSPGLPAISVEDTSESEETSPMEDVTAEKLTKTARPPVELMQY
ncbi:calcineurin binding protein-like protein [Venturia nashicola]|nr:calcineurin binding protein-like protein [Venturia nashicola]